MTVHACVFVRARVHCMYMCVHVFRVCMCVHVFCACICTRACVFVHVCMCVCAHMRVRAPVADLHFSGTVVQPFSFAWLIRPPHIACLLETKARGQCIQAQEEATLQPVASCDWASLCLTLSLDRTGWLRSKSRHVYAQSTLLPAPVTDMSGDGYQGPCPGASTRSRWSPAPENTCLGSRVHVLWGLLANAPRGACLSS